jgi:two-component system sensor histidine kinase YesM
VKEKHGYLFKRIYILWIVGMVLTLVCIILVAVSSRHFLPVAILGAAVILYVFLGIRLVLLPYRETRKIYEQFALGNVLQDFFAIRYPFSVETERANEKIREMLDTNKWINVSKKEAEYLALQNQINPHFLYNTLEGIRSEAVIAGMDSIAEMTEALATFFRYTISHVDHLVTLEDELSNIENYYYIQQFRFGDKLELKIEYDHDEDLNELDILQYRLPKLTLQPIVENSIFHGLEPKIGKGHLTIRVTATDRKLVVRISDDGLGMKDEKVKELNDKLKKLNLDELSDPSKKGGIAIMNVNNRIKLLFGEEYGIYVYSREGAGTDTDISLPIITS